MPFISPSILSADYSNIKNILRELQGNVESIHIDVMDGKFVPNRTLEQFHPEFVQEISGFELVKNVHLMVEDHLKWAEAFAVAGAQEVSFHFETGKTAEGLELLKEHSVNAGVAIKPGTPAEALEEFLPDMDFVMVMSVEPGYAGQAFLPSAIPKLEWLKEHFAEEYGGIIWVDGGVKKENAKLCAEAGAEMLVAASAIFNKSGPFLQNLRELQDIVAEVEV